MIRDIDKPISKAAKIGAIMIREAYEARGHKSDTIGFTNTGETSIEIA